MVRKWHNNNSKELQPSYEIGQVILNRRGSKCLVSRAGGRAGYQVFQLFAGGDMASATQ